MKMKEKKDQKYNKTKQNMLIIKKKNGKYNSVPSNVTTGFQFVC